MRCVQFASAGIIFSGNSKFKLQRLFSKICFQAAMIFLQFFSVGIIFSGNSKFKLQRLFSKNHTFSSPKPTGMPNLTVTLKRFISITIIFFLFVQTDAQKKPADNPSTYNEVFSKKMFSALKWRC